MMEYKVVQGDISEVSEYRLEAQVNRLMQEGWKPKGGVSYMSEGHDNYLQAMIRNVPLPPHPLQRSSAVVGSSSSSGSSLFSSSSDSDSGGSSRKKSKRRLRKTQQRSKRNNQKSRKL